MKSTFLAVVAVLALPMMSFAQSMDKAPLVLSKEEIIKQKIIDKIEAARPGLVVRSVEPSVVEGLYKTTIDNGPVVYSSEDGQFFITGELYQIEPNQIVNVTQRDMNVTRKQLLSTVSPKEMIVFAPKGETKAVVSIFTDVDCGYCQKLHQDIPKYNQRGIEVRYMAFPRAGLGSESYNKIASAWCAKDKQEALTKLKARQEIPTNVCDNNPVPAQYELGGKMGISGTPAIILNDGELIPGYVPADQLANRLGI